MGMSVGITTDRSKAMVPVLFVLCEILWLLAPDTFFIFCHVCCVWWILSCIVITVLKKGIRLFCFSLVCDMFCDVALPGRLLYHFHRFRLPLGYTLPLFFQGNRIHVVIQGYFQIVFVVYLLSAMVTFYFFHFSLQSVLWQLIIRYFAI